MELKEFLVFLSGVGVIGAVSWVFEYFNLMANAEPKQKQLVFFGISVLVAIASYSVLTFVPADILGKIAPFFEILSAIFVFHFLGETYHKTTKL